MRITELLPLEAVQVNAPVSSGEEVLETLLGLLQKSGALSDAQQFRRDVLNREAQGSTALTGGVAIPHAKSTAVRSPALAALTVRGGLECGALDGKKTDLFFLIAVPCENDLHMEVLSSLSRDVMNPGFRDALRHAGSPAAFREALCRRERELEREGAAASESPPKSFRLLAVTSCPTGVAHTYMAAEALTEAAGRLGCRLKTETNGAGGVDNALTPEEIAEADCIIVAADRSVEMERFLGKHVLVTGVGDGVYRPEELLRQAMSGTVPLYEKEAVTTEPIPHRVYRHLMSGVSHMLPFVVAGGILIALSYLLDDYRLGASTLGRNSPVPEFLNRLGEQVFGFMLPVLSAYIAQSIADRPGLAVGFVGGLLAKLGSSFTLSGGLISAGFLGALLAGFAAGYLALGLKWLTKKMPARMDSLRTILIYPVAGVLLIGLLMFLVNPFLSSVNRAFVQLLRTMGEGSHIVLGVVLGSMMASDMGGPLNKSAYVFGTVAMAAGDYDVMAAVMLGGMVPPLATALASTLFARYFTESERRSGAVNYILGLCFITEGAIPFAAADPLRVIPSCMVGSAVAGGLSMAFHCTLIAPNGGVFVFPLVDHVGGYLIALAAGSLSGMALLVWLKRVQEKKRRRAAAKEES